ncbi:hypothetical protein LLG07_02445 [bacterium]|nr:hypothetical protein [bacterium]
MRRITSEISQLILGILIMAAGFGLTVNFLNGLMLIGIILIIAGIIILLRMVVN